MEIKTKNYNRLLIRNHANQRKVKWHFKVLREKKKSICYTQKKKFFKT